MIRIKTINVDGKEIKRTFESVADILTNWWDENGTDLSGGDDEVILRRIYRLSILRSVRYFAELLRKLSYLVPIFSWCAAIKTPEYFSKVAGTIKTA